MEGASGAGVVCSCTELPPKVASDQAMKFAEALVKGTPHAGRIALTTLSDRVRELI